MVRHETDWESDKICPKTGDICTCSGATNEVVRVEGIKEPIQYRKCARVVIEKTFAQKIMAQITENTPDI